MFIFKGLSSNEYPLRTLDGRGVHYHTVEDDSEDEHQSTVDGPLAKGELQKSSIRLTRWPD